MCGRFRRRLRSCCVVAVRLLRHRAAALRLLLCPHQGTPKRNPQPRNTAQPLVSPDSLAPPPFRPMARPRPHDPFKPTRSLLQPPTSVLTDQTARNFQEEMSDGLSWKTTPKKSQTPALTGCQLSPL